MEAEIRGTISIVRTPPTDTRRSDEGRRGRIEEQNLAVHVPLSEMLENPVTCSRDQRPAECRPALLCQTVKSSG